MSNRFFISLLVLCISTLSAVAQTWEVRGKVVDEKNQPLPHAIISIKDKGNVAATDGKGQFSFRIGAGKYTIQVSLLGYKTATKEVDINKKVQLSFRLKEDYKLLGEVIVVGEHSQNMQQGVYAAKSLNVRPYATSNNTLNQLLNHTSGVRIREDGGIGSDIDLSLGGMGGNAIRYFIDGVPLTSLGSGANITNIPINIVDRVEVYKGVVPAELGLDALGGAVNIITRKESRNYLDIALSGGSFTTYGADLNGQYRIPNNGFTVKGNLSYTSSRNNYTMKGVDVWNQEKSEYETGNYPRFHDGYQAFTGEIQAGFTQTRWADEALLGIYYSKSRSEIQTGFSQQLVIGAAERYRDAVRVSVNYSKHNLFVEGLTAKVFASFTNDHLLYADTTFRKYNWDGTYIESNKSEITRRGKMLRHTLRPTTVVRANLAYPITPQSQMGFNYTFTANLNNRRDDYDDSFVPTSDYMSRHILGLNYSQYLWEDRINANLFVKDYILNAKITQKDMYWITYAKEVDPHISRNLFGYGLGTRVAFMRELSVKASYERATRLPTARELLGNGASIYPNFKLMPELAHNFNLTLFGNWHITDKHRLNYEGTFFVRDVSNYIRRDVLDDVVSAYQNVGKARVLGGEIDIKYNYGSLISFAINGTYVDERNRSKRLPDGRMDITYNNRIPNKPFLYANTSLGVNFDNPFGIEHSQLKLNAAFGYVHWFYLSWAAFGSATSKALIPKQTTTNLGVSWSIRNGKNTFSLNCNNLFDEINYDNYKLQKPGRSLLFKVTTFIN